MPNFTYWTPTPTPIITVVPQTTYKYLMDNVTASHFNILWLPANSLAPYGFPVMGIMAVPFFIIFMAYYISLWISHGNLRMASITGLLFGGMFLFAGGGLRISLPTVIAPLAFGALCASIAGFIMSMFKNA